MLEVGRLESSERFRSPDGGAEAPVAQEIVVDPLTENLPGRADRVACFLIEQVHIAAAVEVLDGQAFLGDHLVEIPQPPGVLARRPGSDVGGELPDVHGAEDARQDRHVRAVILQGELEVVA